jgi:AmmeMemoRadiSam system protein B
VEVQIPFLQFLHKDFKFVPIIISCAPLAVYREIAFELARAIRQCRLEGRITIIASSDMTHYESKASAQKKDDLAIKAMLNLDEGKLVERVVEHDISMCGYAPTAIMLSAVKELGAKKAELVKYTTSGDATGDYSSVVGYAGIVVT